MKRKGLRYFPKELLIEFNNAAIRENRNQAFKPEFLESLPDGRNFPIADNVFYHTKDEVRVMIMFDEKSSPGLLDMSIDRLEFIPVAYEDERGQFVLQDEETIRSKFPYKNREWTEKKVKKPYRRQGPFRRKVLTAYNNTCAICEVTDPRLLRAAHIVPVADGGSDEVENGICLCLNHEVAFDRGILLISPEGDISVVGSTMEIDRDKIKYPKDRKCYPSKDCLAMKFRKLRENK